MTNQNLCLWTLTNLNLSRTIHVRVPSFLLVDCSATSGRVEKKEVARGNAVRRPTKTNR